jgi:Heterokaryon incompatibility protein (HET)
MAFQSWPEREWINPPMGVAVKSYLAAVDWETHPQVDKIRVLHRNAGKMWEWSLCCFMLLHDDLEPSFRSTLSKTQLGSFVNLLEWWTGQYQDPRLSAAAIAYTVIDSVVQLPKDPRIRTRVAKLSKSTYHYQMFKLFCLEFPLLDKKPSTASDFPSGLQAAREGAAKYACSQRIGVICYQEAAWKHAKLLGSTRQPKPELSVKAFGDGIAAALTNALSQESVPIRDANQRFKIPVYAATVWPFKLSQVIDSIYARSLLGVVFEPCSWLKPAERDGLPYFLWDVVNEKTVETQGLNSPTYTTVSHTWGRWRLNDSIQLPGAKWRIPKNQRFSVDDLPKILKKVPRDSDYVWFDLVCIPQDRSDTAMAKIAHIEIARQAKIFNTASRAVAWLSDIDSLDGLRSAARWLGLSLLEHPPEQREDFNPLDEETRQVKRLSNPVLTRTMSEAALLSASRLLENPEVPPLLSQFLEASPSTFDRAISGSELTEAVNRAFPDFPNFLEQSILPLQEMYHPWLSSLWTLQEACLRPDIWLCSRDWTVLQLTDDHTPLRLDGLVALVYQACLVRSAGFPSVSPHMALTESVIRGDKAPEEIQSLMMYILSSGMGAIFQPTVTEILLLGSRRYCQRNRSEAIMSVLGIDHWEQTDNDHVVLGKYKLTFINKVRQKWGSTFFTAVSHPLQDPGSTTDAAIGSLLPFKAGYRWGDTAYGWLKGNIELLEHSSVAAWEIHEDGSVRIHEAAIIASSESTAREPIRACIMAPGEREGDNDKNLRAWINSPGPKRYAVCTAYGHSYEEYFGKLYWKTYGLLFERTKSLIDGASDETGAASPISLVNVGSFDIHHEGTIQVDKLTLATKVNWVIL